MYGRRARDAPSRRTICTFRRGAIVTATTDAVLTSFHRHCQVSLPRFTAPLLLVVAHSPLVAQSAAASMRPLVRITDAANIRIDGRLTEPAWNISGLDRGAHTGRATRRGDAGGTHCRPRPCDRDAIVFGVRPMTRAVAHRELRARSATRCSTARTTSRSSSTAIWTALGICVRRQSQRRAVRRARHRPRRERERELGRRVAGATSAPATGWSAEIRIPTQEPPLPARPPRVGTQRPAAHSAPSGDRSLGERRPRLQGDADESRRAAHRTAPVRARNRA